MIPTQGPKGGQDQAALPVDGQAVGAHHDEFLELRIVAVLAVVRDRPPAPAVRAGVADAKVELVKDGFGFTEGPVWVQKGNEGYLLFTDIPGAVVWKLTADGKASV